MYKKIFLWALMCLSCPVFAQQKTIYYDKFFDGVSEQPTQYYRTLERDSNVFRFKDVRRDSVVATGYVRANPYPSLVNDLIQYVEQGCSVYKLKDEYTRMRCEIDYYKNGTLQKKVVSHDAKLFFGQVWNEEGVPLLLNGTGKWVHPGNNGVLHEYFMDSVATETYLVRSVEQDTIHYICDKVAMPKGGYVEFVTELHKYIKYPMVARFAGKEGRVYIQFVVGKDGRLTEFKPLTKEGYKLEEKTVKKLEKVRAWEPAMFRGRPVKMQFVLPVKFRLES